MELTKHALLDRMIGDPESPESPTVTASIHEGYVKKFQSKDQNEIGLDAVCDNCGEAVKVEDFKTADALELFCCGSGNDEGFCQACQDAESPTSVKFDARESLAAQSFAMVFAWINQGYSRETCIRFLISGNHSESFATKIVDQAFTMINEAPE